MTRRIPPSTPSPESSPYHTTHQPDVGWLTNARCPHACLTPVEIAARSMPPQVLQEHGGSIKGCRQSLPCHSSSGR